MPHSHSFDVLLVFFLIIRTPVSVPLIPPRPARAANFLYYHDAP